MDWNDVASAIGISPESLRAIRKGRNGPKELTARALDDWVGWEPGSTERLFEGGEPTPVQADSNAVQARTAHDSLVITDSASATVMPAALAGLSEEERSARIAELSERLDRNAEATQELTREQREIAAELARLLGRTDPGASRAG